MTWLRKVKLRSDEQKFTTRRLCCIEHNRRFIVVTLTGMENYAVLLREMGRKTEAETIEAEIRIIRGQATH
ncbi:MAG TPA: hypothetical protein PLL06_09145 [Acidobacteriota bacterium]|nr:hypothetical protein [Acidobacteriota bacterium]